MTTLATSEPTLSQVALVSNLVDSTSLTTPIFSIADVQALINQVLSKTSSASKPCSHSHAHTHYSTYYLHSQWFPYDY